MKMATFKRLMRKSVFVHENISLHVLYNQDLGYHLVRETRHTSSDLSLVNISVCRRDVVSDYFSSFEQVIFAMQDYLREWADSPKTVELFSLPCSYQKLSVEDFENAN